MPEDIEKFLGRLRRTPQEEAPPKPMWRDARRDADVPGENPTLEDMKSQAVQRMITNSNSLEEFYNNLRELASNDSAVAAFNATKTGNFTLEDQVRQLDEHGADGKVGQIIRSMSEGGASADDIADIADSYYGRSFTRTMGIRDKFLELVEQDAQKALDEIAAQKQADIDYQESVFLGNEDEPLDAAPPDRTPAPQPEPQPEEENQMVGDDPTWEDPFLQGTYKTWFREVMKL
tara:strand:- start:9 stop:707 length:699 start_codon:yes stop_codon:yes gene_type:complete